MDNENQYEIMRTYARAWQTEIVLYHLFGRPLWFPIYLKKAGFFMIGLIFMFFFCRLIPGLKAVPFLGDPIVLYIVLPYLIMKFFTAIELDGKPPHIYFKDQVKYVLENKKFNMYKTIKDEKIKYSSKVGFRVPKMVSIIDLKLLMKGDK